MKIAEVKATLGRRVRYAGADYILTAYILRRGPKGFIHSGELRDLKAENSVLIARLEDISNANQNESGS